MCLENDSKSAVLQPLSAESACTCTGSKLRWSHHVFYESSGDEFTALRSLMRCDVIVVAHSSFSWWAAYLSDTMEVIAPKDLYPRNSIHRVEVN